MAERVVDLDAARAARAEAAKEAPTVVFGGKTFELPVELPWSMVEAASAGDAAGVLQAVKMLLGEQWAEFEAIGPTVADMRILMEHIGTLYGVDAGN